MENNIRRSEGHLFKVVVTYANASRDWGLWDPEGDPREDHQQTGGHVSLQDEVEDAPLQLKVEHQLRVVTWETEYMVHWLVCTEAWN